MANSISAEVWLDERRWDALEVVLEEQGSNIEQHLQEYLLDLYREMVPPDQVREIESDIQKEALETQRGGSEGLLRLPPLGERKKPMPGDRVPKGFFGYGQTPAQASSGESGRG